MMITENISYIQVCEYVSKLINQWYSNSRQTKTYLSVAARVIHFS